VPGPSSTLASIGGRPASVHVGGARQARPVAAPYRRLRTSQSTGKKRCATVRAGTWRPACRRCRRARPDDPLDELHVREAPARELLLVLQQPLGQEEQRRRARARVELLERHALVAQQAEEELLQRRPVELRLHERGTSPCSRSTCRKCGSRSPLAASMARNCTLCEPLELPR
jgi:ribosomal protein L40E